MPVTSNVEQRDMASHRTLTQAESEQLRALFWPRHRFSKRDLKLLMVPGIGILLSTPFAVLFFCAARFMHGEEIARATQLSLYGFLPGLILGSALLVVGLAGASRPTLPGLKEDLAAGSCKVQVYRGVRFWHLVDDGSENPDVLVDLGNGRVLALPSRYISGAGSVRETCTIAVLPLSRAIVSVSSSGDPIPMEAAPVITDNLWRNDDLEWCKPILVKNAASELRAAIERAA